MTMYLTEKYINPFTDYGFKRLFGEEANKDLLLDFLRELLRDEQGEIKNIQGFQSMLVILIAGVQALPDNQLSKIKQSLTSNSRNVCI